jgi:CheY-like chemotaxis protein
VTLKPASHGIRDHAICPARGLQAAETEEFLIGGTVHVRTTERRTRQSRARRPQNGGGDDARPVLFAVEDDPFTLDLLQDVAIHAGWSARGFTRLAEFERAMAERVPDLVILDDELPDGSGGDRARELRRDRRLHGVEVLVCTAAPPPRQAQIGAWVPVVNKPFDLAEIERYLESAARRHGMEARSAGG